MEPALCSQGPPVAYLMQNMLFMEKGDRANVGTICIGCWMAACRVSEPLELLDTFRACFK